MGQGPLDLARVEGVLLDMDGTLVDSDGTVERAWSAWAREYGLDVETVLTAAHGHPAVRVVRSLLPGLGEEAAKAAAQRQYELEYADASDVTAAAGARDLLAALDRMGLAWAVVTTSDDRLAKQRLHAAGIDPPVLVTLDDVGAAKPDPEGYLRAAALLDIAPSACLVVEDSPPGLAAGRAAGMPTAALRGLDGDLRLPGLGRLAHLLERSRVRPWWRDAVGYQVYLPSFADADGDGWGDLAGVCSHLDHLTRLGVEVLWLTPFFRSPMRDHGYDVADYHAVDPSFGGEAALDELLTQAHRRGMRVIGDLVVNHTSDAHPWFTAAASSRTDPHREHYIWRDPAPDGGPPNNWLSHFGGPAWTFSPATGQYYLHLFRPEQPDLNWRDPALATEIDTVLEYWFERGLDGFRIDTAAYLVKDADLRDNPSLPAGQVLPARGVTMDWRRQDHRHDIHQPDVHAVHERWRRIADRHGAFLVGEVYELDPHALARFVEDERLHSSFWFGLVETGWDAERIAAMLEAATTASSRLSWVQGNHDRSRAVTRFGGGEPGRRRSLALHVLMALLPGTFWLFQGEELGLGDGHVPAERTVDPLGAAEPGESRDVVRTPMPWRPGPGLGFTTGRPWLPDGGRGEPDTVAVQADDPASHLNTLSRLLATRRRLAHLLAATDDVSRIALDAPVVAYRRGGLWAVANLRDTPVADVELPAAAVFDTDDPAVGLDRPRTGRVRLAPYQALVLAAR
ncbi:HAD-IA family hydrolase [Actinoallomurus sp. CA-142502]|uniref:HAD-IA family hydrolase n=1 Tax=Actinoallomurus sp. CA-142502 TaxID=3239885 RepID=UPI003D8FA7AB